ncbi:hypothetical protein D3C87_458850 [compost metagenome]
MMREQPPTGVVSYFNGLCTPKTQRANGKGVILYYGTRKKTSVKNGKLLQMGLEYSILK